MEKIWTAALLIAVSLTGTEPSLASSGVEQIHGGTCWLSKDGTTIKAVSFNDRAVGFWNGTTLKADVAKILLSAGLTPGDEVQVSLACSDLGHQLILRGQSLLGHAYCLSTNMNFSNYELMGDSSTGGAYCHPYALQEILIYEPDENVRGQVLSALTARKYAGDIESVSVESSVIEIKLRSHFRFREKLFLQMLNADKNFPEGVAAGLNDVMGFPFEQVELARISTTQ